MKKTTLYILFICVFFSVSFATYTYTITEYQGVSDLTGTESILFTGNGGTGTFGMQDSSFASIQGTSTLGDGTGGIWHIDLLHSSELEMSGGQVNMLSINNDATATLTGGIIQQIWSYQYIISGPHITIVYFGDLPAYNETTNVLTGLWGNGDPFSIYLSDVPASSYGYSPAIDNIRFVPEPTTLALLAFGGLLMRQKQ